MYNPSKGTFGFYGSFSEFDSSHNHSKTQISTQVHRLGQRCKSSEHPLCCKCRHKSTGGLFSTKAFFLFPSIKSYFPVSKTCMAQTCLQYPTNTAYMHEEQIPCIQNCVVSNAGRKTAFKIVHFQHAA